MITLILGKKGSGKTKRLIDMCNAATAESKGNVVFIEKDSTLTYDISHKARLAVADEYGIRGFDSFYGFIAGTLLTIACIVFNKTISGKSYIYPLIPFNLRQCMKRFFRVSLPRSEKKN